jgi:hypothetical protein
MKKNALFFTLVIIAVIFSSCNHENEKYQSVLKENQELKAEVGELRSLLEAKLINLCDTMSVEDKLKQAELDKFKVKAWKDKKAQELEVWEDKEAQELEAWEEKDEASDKGFSKYSEIAENSLKTFKSSDFDNLREYALLCFYRYNHGYSHEVWKKKRKMEQSIESVKNFVESKKEAYSNYQAIESEKDERYRAELKRINLNYENELKSINSSYEQEISEKKKELGL